MGFKARPLGGIVSSKLIVAGVLALDDLKTPKRSEKKIVGGAGVYSSISSSFFTKTALIAAIGNDFPNQIVDKLGSKEINLDCVPAPAPAGESIATFILFLFIISLYLSYVTLNIYNGDSFNKSSSTI